MMLKLKMQHTDGLFALQFLIPYATMEQLVVTHVRETATIDWSTCEFAKTRKQHGRNFGVTAHNNKRHQLHVTTVARCINKNSDS